ncbi:hypothetical protein PG984_013720 [Apiospora sp. TS-2023a]
MNTSEDKDISYLLSLQAVRDRSRLVLKAAEEGALNNFEYHAERLPDVAGFVLKVIDKAHQERQRDFGPDRFAEIPPHGRWQHFDVGGVDRITPLLKKWESEGCDSKERTRRLIDLFFVSVLLDAGAGDVWTFKEPTTDKTYGRSEGIAVASLYMFTAGVFSTVEGPKECVDGAGLTGLQEDVFNRYFQISSENPMVGVSSRVKLLNNVGSSLLSLPRIFGPTGRPGNLVDYLIQSSKEPQVLDYEIFWSALQAVLIPSWPKDRTHVRGQPIGDAWPLKVLADRNQGDKEIGGIQPFHKLTQWLGYSLTVPFVRVLGFRVVNGDLGTGLPEYRNGGLFVDLGVLQLKPETLEQGRKASGQDLPSYSATGDVIVEWRAMTVALLDELYKLISAHFADMGVQFSMAQMLEAGTWKGGRELAAKHRPETKSSPILMDGDGTLF